MFPLLVYCPAGNVTTGSFTLSLDTDSIFNRVQLSLVVVIILLAMGEEVCVV